MEHLKYDTKFYEQQKASNLSSAECIVPLIIRCFGTDNDYSVIDLGCGSGNWLHVFKQHGWKVTGVDGGDLSDDILMIDNSEFVRHDFRNKYEDENTYTLAMSLEVVEHIPMDDADGFLETLTQLSNVVLFSGAIPHQRGKGHINEQYQSYWIGKFDRMGFEVFDVIRPFVWNEEKVRAFYAQNMFLFVKRGTAEYSRFSFITPHRDTPIYDVVHPNTWEQLNQYAPVRVMDILHKNKLVSWVYYRFFKK